MLASEEEERRLNGRLLGNKMGVLRAAAECLRDPQGNVLASGWMPVPAAPPWKRLIQDRRPANATGRSLGWAHLARGCMLTRMVLRPGQHVRASGDDLETSFDEVQSPPSQVARNACGRPIQGGDPRYVSHGATDSSKQDYLCLQIDGMGDPNAVDRTQEYHESFLRKFGAARHDELVGYQTHLPHGDCYEIVYTDDRHVIQKRPKAEVDSHHPKLRDVQLVDAGERPYSWGGHTGSPEKEFRFKKRWTTLGASVD